MSPSFCPSTWPPPRRSRTTSFSPSSRRGRGGHTSCSTTRCRWGRGRAGLTIPPSALQGEGAQRAGGGGRRGRVAVGARLRLLASAVACLLHAAPHCRDAHTACLPARLPACLRLHLPGADDGEQVRQGARGAAGLPAAQLLRAAPAAAKCSCTRQAACHGARRLASVTLPQDSVCEGPAKHKARDARTAGLAEAAAAVAAPGAGHSVVFRFNYWPHIASYTDQGSKPRPSS